MLTAAGDEPTFMDHARASASWFTAIAHLTLPPKYGHDNPSVGGLSTQYDSAQSSSSPHSIGEHILKGLVSASKVNAGDLILKGLVPTTHVGGDWFPKRIEFIIVLLPAIGLIVFFAHMIPGGPANQRF